MDEKGDEAFTMEDDAPEPMANEKKKDYRPVNRSANVEKASIKDKLAAIRERTEEKREKESPQYGNFSKKELCL